MRRRVFVLGSLGSMACLAGCAAPLEVAPAVIDAVPDESILDPLFDVGTEFELTVGGRARVEVRQAGVLKLPTGRVIAADPSWLPSWQRLRIEPYTAAVAPGEYPVSLSVMSLEKTELVAAAKLSIRDSAVARWEPALRPGQDPATLKPDAYFGVGVDIATAGFLDGVALPYMAEQEDKGGEDVRTPLTQLHAQRTDPSTGTNFVIFKTGYGDGHYPVWIGRDADGNVACFVMDMLICRLVPKGS